jgi:Tfp pilus assembly protein PilF
VNGGQSIGLRMTRAAAAFALVAVSITAAYRLCWIRYRCDVIKQRAERHLYREVASDYERVAIARRVMTELSGCHTYDSTDYQTLFLLAVAAENAGRPEQAVALYRRALSYNERPEIYANIAVVQFGLAQPEEATRNMMRACIFDLNHSLRVAQPMQFNIQRAVGDRQRRLLAESVRRAGSPQRGEVAR